MLNVTGLHVTRGMNPVVRGASFELRAGEVLGLSGPSGSGKTTIALAMLGLLGREARVTGSVALAGTELIGMRERDLEQIRGADIGLILQDPSAALSPVHRVARQVEEAVRMPRADVKERTFALLRELGLRGLGGAYPHELSGGQRQRVAIAIAIANNPEVVIADEPATSLDSVAAAQAMGTLMRACQQRGSALLLVTHDTRLLARYADRCLVMSGGRVAETRRPRPAPIRVPAPRSRAPQIVVSLDNVSVGLRRRGAPGEAHPLRGVTLDVSRGEVLGIAGPSGAGKSTLARVLVGLRRPDWGTLVREHAPAPAGAGRPQLVFQDATASLDPRLTVRASITEGLRSLPGPAGPGVGEMLDRVGLDPALERCYPHELSQGQRQRVCIARALAARPRLLVLDEPTSALDTAAENGILGLIEGLRGEMACVLISHDVSVLARVADRLAVMANGEVVEAGSVRRLLEEPRHPQTRALVAATCADLYNRAGATVRS